MLAVINHEERTYSPAGLCVDSDVSCPKCIVSDQFGRLYISSLLDGVIICKPYRHYF